MRWKKEFEILSTRYLWLISSKSAEMSQWYTSSEGAVIVGVERPPEVAGELHFGGSVTLIEVDPSTWAKLSRSIWTFAKFEFRLNDVINWKLRNNTYNRLNHQPAGVYALPVRWLASRFSFWASKGHARAGGRQNNFHLWTFRLYRDWPLFCPHYYAEPCSPLAQFQDTAGVAVLAENSRE